MIFLHTQDAPTWTGSKGFDRVDGVVSFSERGEATNLCAAGAPASLSCGVRLLIDRLWLLHLLFLRVLSPDNSKRKITSISIVGSPLYKLSGKQKLRKKK